MAGGRQPASGDNTADAGEGSNAAVNSQRNRLASGDFWRFAENFFTTTDGSLRGSRRHEAHEETKAHIGSFFVGFVSS